MGSSGAATLLLDDFSSGTFSLGSGGVTSISQPYVTPLTNERTVTGVGAPTWSASLASGELAYVANNPRPGRNYLEINYSSSSTFSILEFDAFAIDVTSVTGTGELIVFVDGAPTFEALQLSIAAPGEWVYPTSDLLTGQSLDSISQINVRFTPVSEDFGVTVDNVRLIPELSSSLFVAFGALVTTLRRRRTQAL